jgi:hypothetical protein
VVNLFERLAQGRPPAEEPTPPVPLATPREALRLLDWLQHKWPQPTIRAQNIYQYGPRPIRDKKSALKAAEILEKRGWLIPLRGRRYDTKRWQITIGPA